MMLYFTKSRVHGTALPPVTELVEKFVLFGYNGFMWFFVPLILIYLSLPFFAIFVLHSSRRLLRLFLVMGLILGCIPPLSETFSVRSDLSDIYIMGSRFLYFIVAGYYIGHFDISHKTRIRLYGCSAASVVIMFAGTFFLTLYAHDHYDYFLAYTNIPCAITAMGVFTFFKYHDWKRMLSKFRLTANNLASLSGLSLGIYLTQAMWFNVLHLLRICEDHILLRFLVMYALCATSVWVMKKVPGVRRLVG